MLISRTEKHLDAEQKLAHKNGKKAGVGETGSSVSPSTSLAPRGSSDTDQSRGDRTRTCDLLHPMQAR